MKVGGMELLVECCSSSRGKGRCNTHKDGGGVVHWFFEPI
jgi:hypothetical protein